MWSEGVIMIARATMMERPGSSTRADRTRGSVRGLHHLTASPSRPNNRYPAFVRPPMRNRHDVIRGDIPAILACGSDQFSPAQQ